MYAGANIHFQTVVAGLGIIKLAREGQYINPIRLLSSTDTKYHGTIANPQLHLFCRKVQTLVFGLAVVLLIFSLGIKHGGIVAALFSSMFVAVTPELERELGIIKPDLPAACFSLVAFLLTADAIRGRTSRLWWWIGTGAASGLAAGFKYNQGTIISAPLLGILFLNFTWPTRFRLWAAVTGAAALGFCVASPYAFLNYTTFVKDISLSYYMYSGWSGSWAGSLTANLKRYASQVAVNLGPALPLVFLGIHALFKRCQTLAVWWLAVMTFQLVFHASYTVGFFRNILAVWFLSVTLSGFGAQWCWDSLRTRAALFARSIWSTALVIVLLAILTSAAWQTLLRLKEYRSLVDSRAIAMDYICREVGPTTVVAVDEHLHVYLFEPWKHPNIVVTNVYNKPPAWFREHNVRYVLLPADFDVIWDRKEDKKLVHWLNQCFQQYRIVREWGKEKLVFPLLIWNPHVVLREVPTSSSLEIRELPNFVPGVSFVATGRHFLRNHTDGYGLELWSKGEFLSSITLDTTATQLKLLAGGTWKHPAYPEVRVEAKPTGSAGSYEAILNLITLDESDQPRVYQLEKALPPGSYELRIRFLNGDEPLPLFDEYMARRVWVGYVEMLP
jgi:hypothetical protein